MTLSDDFYGGESGPAVRHPSERRAWVPRQRVPSNNWAAWSIAFMPLGVVVTNVVIGVAQGFTTWLAIVATTALLLALSVILARADRRELDAWGFENTASPWLVLLAPAVYLAVRGNRVWRRTGAGFGPLWASIAVIVFIPIGFGATGVLGAVWRELSRVYAQLGM
jgi:hypothetical protein